MYLSPSSSFAVVLSEFLPEILSTGLKEDRMSIVNLILSTLKSRVSAQRVTFPFQDQFMDFLNISVVVCLVTGRA